MRDKLGHQFYGRFSKSIVASSAAISLAVLVGWWPLVILATAWLYYAFKNINTRSGKKLLWAVFCANFCYMLILTWWFSRIEPAGWLQTIGPFSPSTWLLIVLLIINLLSSFVVAFSIYLTVKLSNKIDINFPKTILPLIFALIMLLHELIRSTLFAIFTHAKSTPIEPLWNIFSVGSVLADATLLNNWYPWLGLWGVSFVFYLFVALILEAKKAPFKNLGLVLLILLVPTVFNFYGSSQNTQKVQVILLSLQNEAKLSQSLNDEIDSADPSVQILIVLPEYSNLSTSPTLLPSSSIRSQIAPKLALKPKLLIANTEHSTNNNSSYVESYILGRDNKKQNQTAKRFLVPGGEYIIRWAHWVFARIDPIAAIEFQKNRGRSVILQSDVIHESTPIPAQINVAVSACSSIMTPYEINKQIASGAQIVAVNVSYEQFQKTGQYSKVVERFSKVVARSTKRTVLVSALKGPAVLTEPNGKQIKSNDTINTTAVTNSKKSLYTRWGDKKIVLMIILVSTLILHFVSYKNRIYKSGGNWAM